MSKPKVEIQAPSHGSAQDKRVYWRSRRGMAELEQQLLPWVVARFPEQAPARKALYAQLIEYEDWEIFDWFQGREPAPNAELQALVDDIVAFGTA